MLVVGAGWVACFVLAGCCCGFSLLVAACSCWLLAVDGILLLDGTRRFAFLAFDPRTQIHIVLEHALFVLAVGKPQLAKTVLHAELPFAFVSCAIAPDQLSGAVPLIVGVGPFIDVAAFPTELALAVLHVFEVLAGVLVAIQNVVALSPFAFALLSSSAEVTSVYCARAPSIVAIRSMR